MLLTKTSQFHHKRVISLRISENDFLNQICNLIDDDHSSLRYKWVIVNYHIFYVVVAVYMHNFKHCLFFWHSDLKCCFCKICLSKVPFTSPSE